MENERLQQRVAQLRAQHQALDGQGDGFFSTSESFGSADGPRTGFDMGAGGLGPDGEEDGPRKKVRVRTRSGLGKTAEWARGAGEEASRGAARMCYVWTDGLARVAKGTHPHCLSCYCARAYRGSRALSGTDGPEDVVQRVRAEVGEEGAADGRGRERGACRCGSGGRFKHHLLSFCPIVLDKHLVQYSVSVHTLSAAVLLDRGRLRLLASWCVLERDAGTACPCPRSIMPLLGGAVPPSNSSSPFPSTSRPNERRNCLIFRRNANGHT